MRRVFAARDGTSDQENAHFFPLPLGAKLARKRAPPEADADRRAAHLIVLSTAHRGTHKADYANPPRRADCAMFHAISFIMLNPLVTGALMFLKLVG